MIINEKTTAYLPLAFRDKGGKLAAPTAITYRIDCLTTGQAVKAWSALSPAAEAEITLSASDNAILGANDRERRLVTVIAAYGPSNDDQVTGEFSYDVRNLKFVS